MDRNIDMLFDYVVKYNPRSVGIEVSGQQSGFISWIRREMISRNIFFALAGNTPQGGIRPTKDKMSRFQTILPMFKQGKMWFNQSLKNSKFGKEMINELQRATISGFRSKHDDAIDTVSMLTELNPWKPISYAKDGNGNPDPYDDEMHEDMSREVSYIV
jgi:hypothetical protein